MPAFSNEDRRRISDALTARGALLPCPRCGNATFSLLDGYFNQPLSEAMGRIVLGGQTVPTVVLVCAKCGFLVQHAAGSLGLIPREDGDTTRAAEHKQEG